MISRKQFVDLVKQELIASVRVVPVPLSQRWCIDAVVRTPLEVGSTTDTVAAHGRDAAPERLRKFDSIDAAARYLRNAGITTFTVDTGDSISFANADPRVVGVIETTMRIWDEDDAGDEAGARGPATGAAA